MGNKSLAIKEEVIEGVVLDSIDCGLPDLRVIPRDKVDANKAFLMGKIINWQFGIEELETEK